MMTRQLVLKNYKTISLKNNHKTISLKESQVNPTNDRISSGKLESTLEAAVPRKVMSFEASTPA